MTNKLIYGDCINELDKIEPCSIDLIYLDPAFFYSKNSKIKTKRLHKKSILLKTLGKVLRNIKNISKRDLKNVRKVLKKYR